MSLAGSPNRMLLH